MRKKLFRFHTIMLFIVLFVFISISIYGASFNVEETDENSVSSYVIFATDSVWVFRDSVIHSGNIGVMNKGESFFLDDNIEVVIDRDVYFEDETSILGDTLAMRRGASAFNVYHNSILNSGEIRGEEGTVLDVPLSVILPEFPDPKPGSEDIRVYSGDSLVLDPGSYGNVTVSAYGTLIMTGGTYHLNDLKLGHHEAKLLCQGPTEIIINGRMFSIRNTYIGPEKEEDPNMSAKDIHIYVNGLDGNEGFFRNLPKAVQIGRYSEIHANIYAPNGALWIRGDSIAEGAFIGKDVVIGYNVELFWDAARPFDVLYTFADEGLEAAIREALGKSEGDIFQSDLEAITYLDASERNIQDLHGIEGCINLVHLELGDNMIIDLTPLSGLTNLNQLSLINNQISDIGPLAGLVNLNMLVLSNNQIWDISPLQALTSLNFLNLNNNSIEDVSALQNMTDLTGLFLANNNIADILSLEALVNLFSLDIGNNLVDNIWPLAGMMYLNTLYMDNNNVKDISPISVLSNLFVLNLNNNGATDLAPLYGHPYLSVLYLSDNGIQDIAPISDLTNLSMLVLDNNKVEDLTPLSNLTRLSVLYLYGNYIADIGPLSGLLELYELDLINNDISDLTPLVKNCDSGGLGLDDNVYLETNPLSKQSITEHIPYLINQGVQVTYTDIEEPALEITVDGMDGVEGADGVDGVNGGDGIDGVDGVDGVDGIDGVDGVDAVAGVDGDLGGDGSQL